MADRRILPGLRLLSHRPVRARARAARQELAGSVTRRLICDELLARGKVAQTRDTPFGPTHKILNGFIGPNGRHATLVTCWLVADQGGRGFPKLTTARVELHRDKETER